MDPIAKAKAKVQVQNLKQIATVTTCLCPCDSCTGSYIDFSKTFIVRCICPCHNDEVEKKIGQQTNSSITNQQTDASAATEVLSYYDYIRE